MINWILQNLANIIITLLLAVLIASIIVKMVKDRLEGNTACAHGCANCAMHGQCHKVKVSREDMRIYRKWKRARKRALKKVCEKPA